jgi:hypothetical protein
MGKWIYSALIVAGLLGGTAGQARVVADSTNSIKSLTSIGDALDASDHHPVHVLYVHGIDQVGAGDSKLLRESICTRLKLCEISDWKNEGTEYADKGEFASNVQPPTLAYLGSPVWNSPEEWHAAAPFVVHWVVHLRRHPAVLVLDEINWWPLVLSLKCRRIIAAEAHLSGPDRNLLQVCSEPSAQEPGGSGRFYAWIPAGEAAELEHIRPRSVLINRSLKASLVDWGLSDVPLAVGPMGGILRDGLRLLMAKSAAFDPNEVDVSCGGTGGEEKYDWKAQLSRDNRLDQEFVGVTHSLGSYLLFNTLNPEFADAGQDLSAAEATRKTAEENAMRYIFERTSLVYFFANQLEMLEITNLESGANADTVKSRGLAPAPPIPTNPAANFRTLVNRWKEIQSSFQTALHPSDEAARENIQVVAWSDPSDVITYRVPKIGDVEVVNLYVQNATRWFGLLESPRKAHADYAKNKDILHLMFKNTKPSSSL